MPGRIQSIERAAAILRLLSGRSRRLGVAELSGELNLPKGTVHGILRTLQAVGYVEQDRESGKYQLGPALLHMGSSYLDGNELRARALNWADALATQSGESVRIGTLHENQVLVVHHVFRPDDSRQALEVGALMPAHATALGKALLAGHPYVAGELAGRSLLVSYTPETVTDVYRFRQELEEVSKRGWASEVGGHVEVHDVARVILDDVDDAGSAVDGLRRLEHLVRRGGGEDLARTGRVEHPRADKATMHRLVT